MRTAYVYFEETGEERAVAALCRRCYRKGENTTAVRHVLVSPGGVAHESDGYDKTACGFDATGDRWWWRL